MVRHSTVHVFCLSSYVICDFNWKYTLLKFHTLHNFYQVIWWSTSFYRMIQCSYFFICVISKLHILFEYFMNENDGSFPWSTNKEPLFSFMHVRGSDSVASYNYPSRYTVYTRVLG